MASKPEGRRRHSAAFKCEAVRVLKQRRAAGVSLRRVSEELEINAGVLTKWVQAVADAPADANADEIFPGSGRPRRGRTGESTAAPTASPEVELRRLHREHERLRQERDFLKKAAAYFAKGSR